MPSPPKTAKLKLGVSLTLDKSWGQRHMELHALNGLGFPLTLGATSQSIKSIKSIKEAPWSS
jgi:hypothetical protein